NRVYRLFKLGRDKKVNKERRKALQEEYKQQKTYMGVYQMRNKVSGKIYISSTPNLKSRWLTIEGQLTMGSFPNAELQKDWTEFGSEAFTYEVLEEKETDEISDVRWEVKQLEKLWLQKLQPYEEKGYNKPPKE
ncbi:MAG TPA: GIY-YIG nuclease family protein, partial [Anaerovoracaceae bacterium]|nr:GIY-YIG nuclease family protein [Anaerovoracaceae bacterium]